MEVIIQSLGFTAGENLEAFIHEKLEKFKPEAKIIRANITLFIGPDSSPDKYHCEIRLEIPGHDLFTKKSGNSIEKSIIDAVDTVHHSFRKAQEKQAGRNHGSIA
jgi:putative sigma-54 modulation protein